MQGIAASGLSANTPLGPAEWNAAEVLAELKGAGLSASALEQIEAMELDGNTLLRLTEEDFATDELDMSADDVAHILGLVERLKNPPTHEEKEWVVGCVCVDESGNSYFADRHIPLSGSTDPNSIGLMSSLIGARGVIFRETPADYHFEWHTAPRKQYIVNLDAAVQVEVTDGTKRVFEAGEVFYVEDTTGKGHKATSVNNKPRRSLFIPVDDE